MSQTETLMPAAELPTDDLAKSVVKVHINEEMSDSFLAYALSVITSRAIPDIRDGLKPAQRRLLYAMLRMGIRPDTPHRKCARVVGETMGKFHPHGDAALYEALVRLGQGFARNFCLVDPQGNFGSLDDPPAASRYTECRLSAEAMAMLAELDEDTVEFRPTYDGEAVEPVCLPSRLPNLVVNGSVGIAVGMATNMLPHNVGETLLAAVEVLKGLPLVRGDGKGKTDGKSGGKSAGKPIPLTQQILGLPASKLLKLDPAALAEIELQPFSVPDESKTTKTIAAAAKSAAAELDKLMKIMPGPDLPSGGVIIDEGLRDIAATGKGTVRLRSNAEIIAATRARQAIVVTELPWQVGPERVVSRIKSLIADDKLPEVLEVRNFTDREHGLRIQIDCRANVDARRVLRRLYRLTPLEISFAVNNVVLVDGVPLTAGLRQLLRHFVYHRLAVVVRRTHFRRRRDLTRKEILEGFLLALDRIDEVVAIIRAAQDVDEAHRELCAQIGFTAPQATAVLELRLRRLTALERDKIAAELAELIDAIAGYDKLLSSDTELRRVVRQELLDTAAQFPRPRLTRIVRPAELVDGADGDGGGAGGGAIGSDADAGSNGETDDAAAVDVAPCWVTLSANGYLGRSALDDPPKKNTRPHDVLRARIQSSTGSRIWGVSSAGMAVPVAAAALSEIKGISRGSLARKMFGLGTDEEVVGVFGLDAESGGGKDDETDGRQATELLLVSASGQAKRINLAEFAKSVGGGSATQPQQIFQLSHGDRLITAELCSEDEQVMVVSRQAKVVRTKVSDLMARSAATAPVKFMTLVDDDAVIGASCFTGETTLVAVSEKATAKAISTTEFVTQKRGAQGVLLAPQSEPLIMSQVGSLETLLAVSAGADEVPEPLELEITKRTFKTRPTASQIQLIGSPRWS